MMMKILEEDWGYNSALIFPSPYSLNRFLKLVGQKLVKYKTTRGEGSYEMEWREADFALTKLQKQLTPNILSKHTLPKYKIVGSEIFKYCGGLGFMNIGGCKRAVIIKEPKLSLKNNRLHNSSGPAIKYEDGASLYFLNNVNVPKDFLDSNLTVEQVMQYKEHDLRVEGLRKIGLRKLIKQGWLQKYNGYQELMYKDTGILVFITDGEMHFD